MKEINLTMKPVCECGYVFDNLVLKRIRPHNVSSVLSTQFYSYEFDPPGCQNCGRKIGGVTAPLLSETNGIIIFSKKEQNDSQKKHGV